MADAVDPKGPVLCDIPSNPAPEGTHGGHFYTTDKIKLRYGLWQKTQGAAKGTVCLVQGRTEFIEKYYETIADFQQRGFAVASFDWRGQGGSERLISNPRLGYVDSIEDYLTDLRSFHARILLPDCPPPYYLVGHSMGGLVALLAAAEDRLMFDRVFLSSPMLGLGGMPLSMAGMSRLAGGLCFVGLGQIPLSRKEDRAPSEERFAGNPLTSDFRRFARSIDVLTARPDLGVTAPTVRWLASAFEAMAFVGADGFPGVVKAPVLMLAAARDQVVSTPVTEQLGLRMRTARHAVIATARHELFMENDAIRAQVFAAFDAFITDQSTD